MWLIFTSFLRGLHDFDSSPTAFFKSTMQRAFKLFGRCATQRGCPDLRGADYDLGKFSVPVSGNMIVLQAADLLVWKSQP